MKGCIIRNERADEQRAVENLVLEAFWNVYRPGCLEHYVLHCLRDDAAFVPEWNFDMEKDGQLIGQNIFLRAVRLLRQKWLRLCIQTRHMIPRLVGG